MTRDAAPLVLFEKPSLSHHDCRFPDQQGAEIVCLTEQKQHQISLRGGPKTPPTIIGKRTKTDCMLASERHLQKKPDENDLLVMISLISSLSYRQ